MKRIIVNILILSIFLTGLGVLLYPAVSDYVNNRRLPNILLICDFAQELGVSVDYLLDYQPIPNNPVLSPTEAELIKVLRVLPKEKRDVIVKLIEMLSEK